MTRTLVGVAMRLCIELGLHRQKRKQAPSVISEIGKRLFWSCYYLDRELSVSLGRPSSIADHDIDVEVSPKLVILRFHMLTMYRSYL
jgi:hypothetical protein